MVGSTLLDTPVAGASALRDYMAGQAERLPVVLQCDGPGQHHLPLGGVRRQDDSAGGKVLLLAAPPHRCEQKAMTAGDLHGYLARSLAAWPGNPGVLLQGVSPAGQPEHWASWPELAAAGPALYRADEGRGWYGTIYLPPEFQPPHPAPCPPPDDAIRVVLLLPAGSDGWPGSVRSAG